MELERLVIAKDSEIEHLSQRCENLKAELEALKAKLREVDAFLNAEQTKWSKTLEDVVCICQNRI